MVKYHVRYVKEFAGRLLAGLTYEEVETVYADDLARLKYYEKTGDIVKGVMGSSPYRVTNLKYSRVSD